MSRSSLRYAIRTCPSCGRLGRVSVSGISNVLRGTRGDGAEGGAVLGHSIDRGVLRRLGSGEALDVLIAEQGISRADWDRAWQAELRRRVPATAGERRLQPGAGGALDGPVAILRDARGLPHVRRRERPGPVLRLRLRDGPGPAVPDGPAAPARPGPAGRGPRRPRASRPTASRGRSVCHLAARAEAERLDGETRDLLEAFAARRQCATSTRSGTHLPIEFDLLDYRPEPWTVESPPPAR